MGTFNRTPFYVNTPSKSDATDYYFNHYNWKGLNENKNFLTVDQETFEDCDNVYVNSDGLLRSRPALKAMPLGFHPNPARLWTVGNYIIAKSDATLVLLNSNWEEIDSYGYEFGENFTPVLTDDKIFLFNNSNFKYIDLSDYSLKDGYDKVYVPLVKVKTGDVETSNESVNLMTPEQTVIYKVSKEFPIPSELYNKRVKATLYDKNVVIDNLDRSYNNRLYQKFQSVDNLDFSDDDLWMDVKNYNGRDLWFKFIKSTGEFSFGFTDSGIIKSSTFAGTVTKKPKFSEDGHLVSFISGNDIYVISTIKDKQEAGVGITYRYPDFTLIGPDYFQSISGAVIRAYENLEDVHFVNYDTLSILGKSNVGKYSLSSLINGSYCIYYEDGTPGRYCYEDFSDNDCDCLGVHCSKFGNILLTNCVFDNNLYTITWMPVQNGATIKFKRYNFNFSCNHYDAKRLPDTILFTASGANNYIRYGEIGLNGIEISHTFKSIILGNNFWYGKIMDNGNVLYRGGMYNVSSGLTESFVTFDGVPYIWPVAATSNCYFMSFADYDEQAGDILTNDITNFIDMVIVQSSTYSEDIQNFINALVEVPLHVEQLDSWYFGTGENLYISEYRESDDGEFLWYFPKYTHQTFDDNFTGLQVLSSDEMGLFFEHEIWYSRRTDNAYAYSKSKLPVGLKQGSNIIIDYDGATLMFPTYRGLAKLSYQDFVATTDQTVTYLSDNVFNKFGSLVESGTVRLVKYKFWLICYVEGNEHALLYDFRNKSWWPITLVQGNLSPVVIDENIYFVLTESPYSVLTLSLRDDDYYDEKVTGDVSHINWSIKSQKLHLNAVNNYKHISNITLLSVLDSNDPMQFNLTVTNYRKQSKTTDIQTSEYEVDAIRTFVKRVSFPKVNEFQYKIVNDAESFTKVPLSLSGITVKYRIGSQVR